jgi:hypothetical protein
VSSGRNSFTKKGAVFDKRNFLCLWHRGCRIEAQNPWNSPDRRGSGAIDAYSTIFPVTKPPNQFDAVTIIQTLFGENELSNTAPFTE